MTTRQLKISGGSDLSITEGMLDIVSGRESLAQTITQRLRTSRGEWRYNLSYGIPYLQIIADRASDEIVREIFREVILDTPGVASITRLELSRDRTTRVLTVTGEVIGVDGVTEVFTPVVVEAGRTSGDGQ